jgi:hypothetical protein
VKDASKVKFLLATVPDPMHTRLSLFMDTSVQAIQSAATDAGWLFATQWLPWNDTVDPDETDPQKRSGDREFIRNHEKQPGVLVFRGKFGSDASLIVFLVGETPTAGVNPAQFQIARAYMRAIREPDQIRIQGPTFSGSLYSLDKLVEEDKKNTKAAYWVRGTVYDRNTGNEFGKQDRVNFGTVEARPDFEKVLEALNIQRDDAAILLEDETGYAQSVKLLEDPHKVRIIRFPRDISHLRNAYREVQQTSRSNAVPMPDLDFSLKDSDSGEDSIPIFSKTQSPLSQSAVLNEIASAIRRQRIRIVQIDATNVLDLLFLARVLKRQCPDTRLLISRPDLLFVEAAQTDALTGTLALSAYPLFTTSVPAAFPDDNAAAVYKASSLLLNGDLNPVPDPPVWLLTLDRESFSPVRVWPPASGQKLPIPPGLWMFISGLTALTAVALLVWTILLKRDRAMVMNAAFAIEAMDTPADRRRLLYLFLLALLLTAIQAVLCGPFWVRRLGWQIVLTKALPIVGVASAGICAVLALRRTEFDFFKSWARAIGVTFAAFLVIPVLWLLCCYGVGEEGFFFSFRAAELRIGTSPVWPVLAAMCVLLLFSLVHLMRLHLAVYERPEVAVQGIKTALQPKMEEFYNRFNKSTESTLGLWKKEQWFWAGGVLGLAVILFWLARMNVKLSSIDGPAYNSRR